MASVTKPSPERLKRLHVALVAARDAIGKAWDVAALDTAAAGRLAELDREIGKLITDLNRGNVTY